jgi:hypothetical protein
MRSASAGLVEKGRFNATLMACSAGPHREERRLRAAALNLTVFREDAGVP